MNIATLKNIAGPQVGRAVLVVRKFSPQILTAVGIAGVVTSSVMACKATLKLESTVDEAKANIDEARQRLADHEETAGDHRREMAVIYAKNTINVAKLYAPAVTLGLASIACIVGGHGIMQKRNVALAAAYKGLEQSFNEYRKRVVEELGDAKERDIRSGIREEVIKDAETGEEQTVVHVDPNQFTPYAKFFDETNANWEKNPELNLLFIKCRQNWANDKLHAQGFLFLNDVYEQLGIPKTSAGQVVGWVLNKGGDNYVDFGIYDFTREAARSFVNGQEDSILLDFNVDGVVWNLI